MFPVRITVLKRLDVPELAERLAARGIWDKCWLQEGQVFEVSANGSDFPKPEGFCSWAWADIQRDITLLRYGVNVPWMRHPGTMISSCTDGRKPVVFKLERIGSPESSIHTSEIPDTRITVVKRFVHSELIAEYATGGEDPTRCVPCNRFTDGQTFISKRMAQPDGFCSWAWADIQRDVVWVALGGIQPNHRHPGDALACCSDGLRQVVFHIERTAEQR